MDLENVGTKIFDFFFDFNFDDFDFIIIIIIIKSHQSGGPIMCACF